jgi:peptide/nickel transport system permease protein
MLSFIVKRLAWSVPTALMVVVVVFSILHLAPGDPARLVAGDDADPQTLEAIRHDLGLDKPLLEQLAVYTGNLLRLDLGRSIHSKTPVRDELAARLPATAQLAVASLIIAVVLGLPIGMATAVRSGTIWDLIGSLVATILVSAPNFFVGMVLIVVFSVGLGWFPAAGSGGLENLVLPAFALSGYSLALVARVTRSECLEVLGQDYVRTARAKGLRENVVLYRHVLKNALLPILTVIGLQFGHALGGAVVVESVFAWPGVGRLVIEAIFRRDFPMVQGALLIISLSFLLVNLLVDVAYAYADPRIRYR